MTLPWIKEREERLEQARASLEIDTTLASSPSAGDIQKAGRTFRGAYDDLLAQRDVLIELLVAKIDPHDKERRDFVQECLSTGMVPMKAPKAGRNLDEEDIKELSYLRNEHIRLSWHLPITPHSSGREDLAVKAKRALEEARANGWHEASEVPDMPKPLQVVLRAKADAIFKEAKKAYSDGDDSPRKKGKR